MNHIIFINHIMATSDPELGEAGQLSTALL